MTAREINDIRASPWLTDDPLCAMRPTQRCWLDFSNGAFRVTSPVVAIPPIS